jgi:MFS family permease
MSANPARKPPLFTQRFVALLCVQTAYGVAFSTFFVLPRFLIEELHAPAALVGNAHGAFALSGALIVPWLGGWIHRFGARRTLAFGTGLGALTFGVVGHVTAPWLLLSLRALHGVSFSLVFTSGSVLAVEAAPSVRRAEAMGYFGTAMLVTNAFGPALAEYLVRVSTWTTVFWVCSLCSAIGLGCVGRLAENAPRVESVSQEAGTLVPPWSRTLAGCYLASVAIGIGVGASKTFVPAMMVSAGNSEVSSYFIAFTAGALLQRTALGWLPDRVGYGQATAASLLVYAGCMVAFVLVPIAYVPWVSFGLGMAHGAAYPASIALTMSHAAAADRGRATAWHTGFYNAGFALSGSGLVLLESRVGYGGLVAVGGLLIATAAAAVMQLTQRAM